MGYMAVITVLNDALHYIGKDRIFGQSLAEVIMASNDRGSRHVRSVPAYSEHGVFCNAAEVISQDHADGAQFVVAAGNTGWRISGDPEDGVPDYLIKELEFMLRERRKAKKAREAEKNTSP